jgi:hypothetical protein
MDHPPRRSAVRARTTRGMSQWTLIYKEIVSWAVRSSFVILGAGFVPPDQPQDRQPAAPAAYRCVSRRNAQEDCGICVRAYEPGILHRVHETLPVAPRIGAALAREIAENMRDLRLTGRVAACVPGH